MSLPEEIEQFIQPQKKKRKKKKDYLIFPLETDNIHQRRD
jgi:hypothetical protein